MNTFFYIITASFLISLSVWVAVLFLYFKKETLKKITIFLVSLSAGALIGGVFLHLLPEASEKIESGTLYLIVLIAFIFFFLMEKILHWRHCHEENCSVHSFGYMNLIGDSFHNFIDGIIIASTFIIDIKLGITTTIAIALHEIPQEIGDFGVLIHAGFEKKKALIMNYAVALFVLFGALVGYFLSSILENIVLYLVPFAAGGFIYIAASDLIPEIRKEENFKKSIASFLFFILGIILMFLIKLIN
ncbi:ZIP family metal transporter [Patescibacteria group bacterium]|nr:ZIP family metal transporter [Patescibacteria group bacterium]